jgi:molybdate transport system substrate-binding protein
MIRMDVESRPRPKLVGWGLLVWLVAVGCRASESPPAEPQMLSVFAASSLTEAFAEVGRDFETHHPRVKVRFHFAGSQVLRLQIEQGARADAFASANPVHIEALRKSGAIAEAVKFAQNELVVAVVRNGGTVERFEDLVDASRIVVGTEGVPVGAYARQVLERAKDRFGDRFVDRVWSRVVSRESNVRLVRAKVELGEADAAFVYRTDTLASERLRVVPIPKEAAVRASYWIGVPAEAAHPKSAERFVRFVRSEAGAAILERHGFRVPGSDGKAGRRPNDR